MSMNEYDCMCMCMYVCMNVCMSVYVLFITYVNGHRVEHTTIATKQQLRQGTRASTRAGCGEVGQHGLYERKHIRGKDGKRRVMNK